MNGPEYLYFGCNRGAGHYLFEPGMRSFHSPNNSPLKRLERFDGMLPPQGDSKPYRATISRLGGIGYSALAFWDYSVDERSGSNSVLFARSLTISPDDLVIALKTHFPQVWARLPKLEIATDPSLQDA